MDTAVDIDFETGTPISRCHLLSTTIHLAATGVNPCRTYRNAAIFIPSFPPKSQNLTLTPVDPILRFSSSVLPSVPCAETSLRSSTPSTDISLRHFGFLIQLHQSLKCFMPRQ